MDQIAEDKIYDGTLNATLTHGTLSGVVGDDAVGLVQAGSFTSADPGIDIPVTAADALSGSSAGNYTLTQPTGLHADIDVTPTQSYQAAISSASSLAASGSVSATGVAASATTPAPSASASSATTKFDVDGLNLTVITGDDDSLLNGTPQ